MMAKRLLMLGLVSSALTLRAAEPLTAPSLPASKDFLERPDPLPSTVRLDTTASAYPSIKSAEWNGKWGLLIGRKASGPAGVAPGIPLGKSDFKVSGPLVDTFRLAPRYAVPDRTLAQKILDLPIINIFVPEPMPKPTRQGKYFYWGERATPWCVTADRPIPGPQGVLISVSR